MTFLSQLSLNWGSFCFSFSELFLCKKNTTFNYFKTPEVNHQKTMICDLYIIGLNCSYLKELFWLVPFNFLSPQSLCFSHNFTVISHAVHQAKLSLTSLSFFVMIPSKGLSINNYLLAYFLAQ